MNKDRLSFKEIIILVIIVFVPICISSITCILNGQKTIHSYVLVSYIGELIMLIVMLLYQKEKKHKDLKVSEEATQHMQENKEDSV